MVFYFSSTTGEKFAKENSMTPFPVCGWLQWYWYLLAFFLLTKPCTTLNSLIRNGITVLPSILRRGDKLFFQYCLLFQISVILKYQNSSI
jgi:hypothetical protein